MVPSGSMMNSPEIRIARGRKFTNTRSVLCLRRATPAQASYET
jgi:hypothetical protein